MSTSNATPRSEAPIAQFVPVIIETNVAPPQACTPDGEYVLEIARKAASYRRPVGILDAGDLVQTASLAILEQLQVAPDEDEAELFKVACNALRAVVKKEVHRAKSRRTLSAIERES